VDAKCPPAFLCGASDDRITDGLATLYLNLRHAGVRSEIHLYNIGGHGFGTWIRPMAVSSWTDRLADWMTDMGYLKKP
jgi:acetyl esterase/lipase